MVVGSVVVVVCESNQKDKGQDEVGFFSGTLLAALPPTVLCVVVVVVIVVLFCVDLEWLRYDGVDVGEEWVVALLLSATMCMIRVRRVDNAVPIFPSSIALARSLPPLLLPMLLLPLSPPLLPLPPLPPIPALSPSALLLSLLPPSCYVAENERVFCVNRDYNDVIEVNLVCVSDLLTACVSDRLIGCASSLF